MKILLVTDYGMPYGGSEVNTIAIKSELRKRGHDARMFSSCVQLGACGMQAEYTCYGSGSRLRTLIQTVNPWAFLRLQRVLSDFRPDVVHVRTFLLQLSPLILPLLRNVPSVYHVVLYKAICPMGNKLLPAGSVCREPAGVSCYKNGCLPLRGWWPLMLQMWLWRRWRLAFNKLLAPSDAMKSILAQEGIGPVEVVWNGFPMLNERSCPGKFPLVTFAGRLVPEKGVDVLLRAFAKVVEHVRDAQLLLAGDGMERMRLERMTADMGLTSSVVFAGHLSQPEMEFRFANAWVQVVPSRWLEPFGNVAAESMMRGTAVVASRTGGPAEFIRDGETGFLVPPGDVDALAGILLRLLRNRDLAESVGNAGRNFALNNLTISACVDRIVNVYKTLMHDGC